MSGHVTGLHHATLLSASAREADAFLREGLGLGRVKRTVNRDEPGGQHLYHGDGAGTPGTLVGTAAFPNLARGRAGVGEVGTLVFAVAQGSLKAWRERLETAGGSILGRSTVDGRNRLWFEGPEGQGMAMQVVPDHPNADRGGSLQPFGLYAVSVRVADGRALGELLGQLGFERIEDVEGVARYALPGAAGGIEVESIPDGPPARPGAGSVHHVALLVRDDDALRALRGDLAGAGHAPGPDVEGVYFRSFFLRAPEGILIEFATPRPGLSADESPAALGTSLVLPPEAEAERARIEGLLEPLDG